MRVVQIVRCYRAWIGWFTHSRAKFASIVSWTEFLGSKPCCSRRPAHTRKWDGAAAEQRPGRFARRSWRGNTVGLRRQVAKQTLNWGRGCLSPRRASGSQPCLSYHHYRRRYWGMIVPKKTRRNGRAFKSTDNSEASAARRHLGLGAGDAEDRRCSAPRFARGIGRTFKAACGSWS